jgi:regulatory protein
MRKPRNEELALAREQLERLLKFRPRSVREAQLRLERAGYSPAVIEQVIREAEEQGWLDDEAFAKLWIRDRLSIKPKGRELLHRELKAKGIPDELIERAFAEIKLDEEALIRALIERQKERYLGLDQKARERRLYAFLRRRGFSPEMIRRVLHPR